MPPLYIYCICVYVITFSSGARNQNAWSATAWKAGKAMSSPTRWPYNTRTQILLYLKNVIPSPNCLCSTELFVSRSESWPWAFRNQFGVSEVASRKCVRENPWKLKAHTLACSVPFHFHCRYSRLVWGLWMLAFEIYHPKNSVCLRSPAMSTEARCALIRYQNGVDSESCCYPTKIGSFFHSVLYTKTGQNSSEVNDCCAWSRVVTAIGGIL